MNISLLKDQPVFHKIHNINELLINLCLIEMQEKEASNEEVDSEEASNKDVDSEDASHEEDHRQKYDNVRSFQLKHYVSRDRILKLYVEVILGSFDQQNKKIGCTNPCSCIEIVITDWLLKNPSIVPSTRALKTWYQLEQKSGNNCWRMKTLKKHFLMVVLI